jgi:hypothetical protein
VIGLTLLAGGAVEAQTPAPGASGGKTPERTLPTEQSTAARDSLRFDGGAGQIDVRAPRLVDPEIRIDGRIDESAWAQAAVLIGFTQYEPNEGIPAVEPTEALVLYAPDAIYFGIRAFDSQPSTIPARLVQRDRGVFSDDWVRIALDTFNDERQAYVFYVNPLGIQADGLWLEGRAGGRGGGGGGGGGFGGSPVDMNPDFIWDSDGRVTEDGWVAEIRIPYISIQFPEGDDQVWRINVTREVDRLGYRQSWAPLTKNQTSTLAQSGRLVGLTGLNPKKLLEINPVVTGMLTGEEVDDVFSRGSVEPEFGLDGRYGITRNLTLGATINPDFSQVEADADQIAVNERFALFFSEKRPFFLDGTEVFRSPTQLVHTRQIVDPSGGAKLTGKIGGVNLAYLGALDDSPVSLGDGENRALFNLARVRADVGAGSAIGFLYTDRSMIGEATSNRVASADARFLFGRSVSLTTQVAGSWTREADEEGTEDGAAPADFGALWHASLRQSGREFSWSITAEDVAPDFQTETGFIRRVGDMRTSASVDVNLFKPPGSALQSIGFDLQFEGFFDHSDFWSGTEMTPFEHEVELRTNFSFQGSRMINLTVRNGYFRFRPESYEDYEVVGEDGSRQPFSVPAALKSMWAGALSGWYRMSQAVQLRGSVFAREIPIFAEASRGFELRISPSLSLRPTTGWQLDLSYTLSRLWREDGSFFSSADIPRLRTQYQFSKSLFARVILQYDLSERQGLRDPTTGLPIAIDDEITTDADRGRFLTQILVSYEPSPRTVFFIGWSRQMEGDRTFALGEMDPINEGFFAKLSYLLRI